MIRCCLFALVLLFPFAVHAQVPATEQAVIALLTKKWTPIQIGIGEQKDNVPATMNYFQLKADSSYEIKARRKKTRGTWRYDHAKKLILGDDNHYIGYITKLTPYSMTLRFMQDGKESYIMYKPLLQ